MSQTYELFNHTQQELVSINQLDKRIHAFHQQQKKCLGSTTVPGWLFKPFSQVFSLTVLKSFFNNQARLRKHPCNGALGAEVLLLFFRSHLQHFFCFR